MAMFETPYFVYDLDGLAAHIKSLQNWPVTLWYALKANPLSDIIKTVYQNGMRVDVASIGELDQVLRAGVSPKDILHTGPAKSKAQLAYFLEKGVRTFVCESEQQLRDLNHLVEALRQAQGPSDNSVEHSSDNLFPELVEGPIEGSVEALLRVQLNWEADGENVLGGACVTPFGLDPESWVNARPAQYQNVNIIGMHCFQWGNILDVSKLKTIWQRISAELIELAEKCELDINVIDLGGGLGIPYEPQDKALSVEAVGEVLRSLKSAYPQVDYWLELGRYAVGPFGQYYAQVVDRKTVCQAGLDSRLRGNDGKGVIARNEVISCPVGTRQSSSTSEAEITSLIARDDTVQLLVLNGGSHHLMRPAITNQAFPVSLERDSQASLNEYQIHGPLCTGIDQLATVSLPSDIQAGDWLVFSQTGAYGFTESMPWFLCHELPGEVVIENGKARVVREPKGADAWLV